MNKKTIKLTNDILSNYKNAPSPIIIIQGDHGAYHAFSIKKGNGCVKKEINNNCLRDYMSILNAYYLPDGGSKFLYEDISPVNSFRVIFDYYFNTDFGLLEDKNYFYGYPDQFDLRDVTEMLRA